MSKKLSDVSKSIASIDLHKIVQDTILTKKEAFVNENRKELYAGKDSEGVSITPSYTPYTRKMKAANNQPFDRVTLKDTGSFYEKIGIKRVNNDTYQFFSSDAKTSKLEAKYGKYILGVKKDNKVFEDLRNEIVKKIKERIVSSKT